MITYYFNLIKTVMKKLLGVLLGITFTIMVAVLPNTAMAVVADPDKIEFVQPDNSKIMILLKGDEKVRWAETIDGYSILFNKSGTYEYAILDQESNMIPSGIQANNETERSKEEILFLSKVTKNLQFSPTQIQMMKSAWAIYSNESQNAFPTTGNRSLVCILIGYTDVPFTKSNADFTNLFNQINYTTGGATGSVKDYYLENSYNQLNLTVTVAGPYTASNTMAYYGANNVYGDDSYPRELVSEAATLANPDVNYANFDNDNNGSVDGVYVIYAGYGEEAGASSNAIWAHAWSLATPITLDGKTISKYSCSPELRSNTGTNITNIGVICHEFGHVLGAPDFYDTDYTAGGSFSGTGYWDMMAGGSWNNGGKTPAHHNAYTKTVVYGWATSTLISSGAVITLNNAAENLNSFYRYNTATTNEYFLIENRQQIKFDSYLPGHGMIIYHVNSSIGSSSINITHPQKMYPICANATTNPSATPADYGSINSAGCPFPGSGAKTSFTDASIPSSLSWAGVATSKPITGITENITNKTVSFTFMGGTSCTAPTVQATNFSSSAITDNSVTIGWSRGTGNSVIVIARKGSTVTEYPVNSIAYTADAAFGSGSQIGSGNFVVYNGPGSSVNITSLVSGSIYYFAVYEYTSSSYCYLTPPLLGNITTTGTPPCTYCNATGTTGYQTGITLVKFNTMNNSTGKTAAYNDYTTQITSVNRGSSYTLTANLNTDGYYVVHAFAWIDWNKDCDFLDSGESYDLGTATNVTNGQTTLSPLNITIPATASIGTTRLRISAKYGTDASSCETGYDGEVEDYSINVTAGGCTPPSAPTVGSITQPTCTVTTGSVVLNGLPSSGTWTLTKTPGGTTYNASGTSYTVTGLAQGTYTFTVASTVGCTSNASANVIINALPFPLAAATISGLTTVCQGQSSVTYTVPSITNATSYVWTLPTGATGTSSTNSITVSYGTTAISGNITVAGRNSCGDGTSSALAVTVNALPTNAGIISGAPGACQGQTGVIYTVPAITNATSYIWTFPTGATGTSNTNSISVNYGASATSGNITVKGNNSCGNGSSSSLAVTVNQSNRTLQLKLFLQGLYAGSNLMNQAKGLSGAQYPTGIADKVTVQLHYSTSPYSNAYEVTNVDLRTNGTITVTPLPCNIAGSYYIVVKHRNSIETWSSSAVAFGSSGTISYDFTTAATKAYGSNLTLNGTVYTVWCGDKNQDGVIDGGDMSDIDNASKPPALQGYNPEDLNGDGVVDGSDMTLVDNNSNYPTVSVKKP